mgnify:CR=1 FL=1
MYSKPLIIHGPVSKDRTPPISGVRFATKPTTAASWQFMLFFRGQARNERLERCQNVFGAVFQYGMRGVRQVQQARTFNLLGQFESLAAGNQEVIIAMDHKKRIDRTD